ncbi:hypothetical protein BDY24DRAFT_442255 [Mrakia frigida]|uniref:uncharacterized protein n=1 Tax=Mrakia frigida TaxID=29902 RepID=UPI003FCC0E18
MDYDPLLEKERRLKQLSDLALVKGEEVEINLVEIESAPKSVEITTIIFETLCLDSESGEASQEVFDHNRSNQREFIAHCITNIAKIGVVLNPTQVQSRYALVMKKYKAIKMEEEQSGGEKADGVEHEFSEEVLETLRSCSFYEALDEVAGNKPNIARKVVVSEKGRAVKKRSGSESGSEDDDHGEGDNPALRKKKKTLSKKEQEQEESASKIDEMTGSVSALAATLAADQAQRVSSAKEKMEMARAQEVREAKRFEREEASSNLDRKMRVAKSLMESGDEEMMKKGKAMLLALADF